MAENKKNFVPLNRQIQNHWLWKDREPFDKRSAWIDLIMLANHTDTKTIYKGEVIVCKRGDVNLSMLQLSDRWRWSRDKTRRFLHSLESDNMITIDATTHRTTITLVNYEVFNNYEPTKTTTDNTTDHTTSRQQAIQQADTTNKDNNINKDINKENKSADFLSDIWDEFCTKLSKVYPAERFDTDYSYQLWIEKVKDDENPREKSKKIFNAISNFIKKHDAEEMKYVPKLSNVLGKDYKRIVTSALEPDSIFKEVENNNTCNSNYEDEYERFCKVLFWDDLTEKIDTDNSFDEWKNCVDKIGCNIELSSSILGHALYEYIKKEKLNVKNVELSELLKSYYSELDIEKAKKYIFDKRGIQ